MSFLKSSLKGEKSECQKKKEKKKIEAKLEENYFDLLTPTGLNKR
jgi:hypothetical protein